MKREWRKEGEFQRRRRVISAAQWANRSSASASASASNGKQTQTQTYRERQRAHSWMEWWKKGTWHSLLNAEWVSEWAGKAVHRSALLWALATLMGAPTVIHLVVNTHRERRGADKSSMMSIIITRPLLLPEHTVTKQTDKQQHQQQSVIMHSLVLLRMRVPLKAAAAAQIGNNGVGKRAGHTHRPTDQNITNRKLTDVHRGRERERSNDKNTTGDGRKKRKRERERERERGKQLTKTDARHCAPPARAHLTCNVKNTREC